MKHPCFRGWHKTLKKMVLFNEMHICEEYSTLSFGSSQKQYEGIGNLPGSYGRNDKGEYVDDLNTDIESWEIMQFTGVRDENGRAIFEGDIVEYEEPDFESGMYLGVVSLIRGAFCVDEYPLHEFERAGVKVIGNIHEHPERLPPSSNE